MGICSWRNTYLVDSLHRVLYLVQSPLRRKHCHVSVVLIAKHIYVTLGD